MYFRPEFAGVACPFGCADGKLVMDGVRTPGGAPHDACLRYRHAAQHCSRTVALAPNAGQRIKKVLYAKEIGPLPDALFSPPQSEEQCCELDRSTARLLALESHREALAYDSPVFIW